MHPERRVAVEMQTVAAELTAMAMAPAGVGGLGSNGVTERGQPAHEALNAFRKRLDRVHQQVLSALGVAGERLRTAGMPQAKLDRHSQAQEQYLARMRAVLTALDEANRAETPAEARAALAAAADQLGKSTDERPHIPFEPSRLPFRGAEPVWREPKGTEAASAEVLHRQGPPVRRLAEVEVPPPEGPATTRRPTPEDLAPSEDVQITPEIEALASQLGNEPRAIFNWVRNHIQFYPTWGSVQGSQMTLEAKRGNAFDQASLLIALLRAAGVPARYVTGTIQVPVADVQNWVGGAESPAVAQQILGVGGVANVGLTVGTSIEYIRLDHVWVEAWIDYIPSRGAVQDQGDTWLPLDPSFKLHTFTPVSSVFTDVPLSDFVDTSHLPFNVDERLGKITDLDTELLDQEILDWVQATDEVLLARGLGAGEPGQVLEALLGGRRIIEETSTVSAASLPYTVVKSEGALSALPQSLRHAIELKGFASQSDRASGNPTFSIEVSLPELNSRRLGIHFEPATQADADILDHARTSGASSLPAYLIDVAPSVQLNGAEIVRGAPVGMGGTFLVDVTLRAPSGRTTTPFQVVAGDEIVVGVTGNGIAPSVVERRFIEHPVDEAAEYLHQVQMHYWAESDHLGAIAARGLGVHAVRLTSVGLFSSPLTVSTLLGAPWTGVYQGRAVDVRQSLVGGAAEDSAAVALWVKQAGYYGSYLEGSIFEQLESASSATPVAAGISSVHLIAAAASRGVPIYYVTPESRATVMPLLQLDAAVEADIDRALRQGQTALVPERNIDLGPWRGAGYILQDESTGAGAYLISGGTAGGGWLDCLEELVPSFTKLLQFILFVVLFLLALILIIAAIAGSGGALAPVGAAAAAFLFFLLFWRGAGPTTAPVIA